MAVASVSSVFIVSLRRISLRTRSYYGIHTTAEGNTCHLFSRQILTHIRLLIEGTHHVEPDPEDDTDGGTEAEHGPCDYREVVIPWLNVECDAS